MEGIFLGFIFILVVSGVLNFLFIFLVELGLELKDLDLLCGCSIT
jgi:hypothetical protein